MEVELEASPESEPLLTFTPGNVTLSPVINIQAFVLLPNSSDHRPLFQLRAVSLLLTEAPGSHGASPSLSRVIATGPADAKTLP